MRALPNQPESPNIRALGQWLRERFTGLSGNPSSPATFTLSQVPSLTQFVDASLGRPQQNAQHGLELVFKDGSLLDPGNATTAGDYTIDGQVITLTGTTVVGDKFVVFYPYRTGV